MNKQEFLARLRKKLSGLPNKETEDRLTFYSEMIDDRMEDGLSEDEAVAAIGNLEEIVQQILGETPRPPVVVKPVKKAKPPKDNTKLWLILLLILFLSFNTQNLVANVFFWLFPMMALVERGLPLLKRSK